MHYLLFYEVSDDYLSRRGEFRAEHLELAWQAVERGELLLFEADAADVPAAFAVADPYVRNGLVLTWSVRPWHTVVGPQASNPVRP